MATRKCGKGKIYRKSYTRKVSRSVGSVRGSRKIVVRGKCIRDVGAPGKGFKGGPGIGPLRKGELVKFGYSHVVSLPVAKRRAALTRAVKAYGSLRVWRKLNAVQVYTRRLSPASSKVFKADMDWVRLRFKL